MSVLSSQVALRRKPSAVEEFFNSFSQVRKIVFSTKTIDAQPHSLNRASTEHESTQVWCRVGQLAAKHPEFTENAIRAQIFAAKPRLSAKTKNGNTWLAGNGLSPAIRKCGRSILINEPMYAMWIETGSCEQGSEK